ncbi:MAG: leucyl aminopeptidase family protein [Legionellales bacterium]|nr:leucyl aminopeptidase family protein [Legionellales bacterium]
MRALNCYQTCDEGTTPLVFLSEAECLSGLPALTTFERNALLTQSFKGRIGDIGLILNQEGGMCRGYVGFGDHRSDALAISAVSNRLPEGCYRSEELLSQSAMVAWSLAQYQFDRYKSKDLLPRVLSVCAKVLPEILAEADAIFLVRDLINTPTNDLGPAELADVLEKMATEHGAEFEQWEGEDLRVQFPAIHAVGRAAAAAPRLLSLLWGEAHHPKVTLVGKGVCFDSGGLDIKPCSGMRFMKKDMAGAAHVMGLAQWMMTQHLPIRLQVLIPAVENAIDAEAYRPGDVLTMRNGLTVEVHNTDAEGRLVLADALVKACEDKPEVIIDFATLTGAARVAVGTEISAVFSNNDKLVQALEKSALMVDDPIWRLPLFAGYEELFASSIADVSNASEAPYGGAITAALFLQRFITKDVPWAHFDIMAWNVGSKPGRPEGGEAMGLRAVGYYLCSRYGARADSISCV